MTNENTGLIEIPEYLAVTAKKREVYRSCEYPGKKQCQRITDTTLFYDCPNEGGKGNCPTYQTWRSKVK